MRPATAINAASLRPLSDFRLNHSAWFGHLAIAMLREASLFVPVGKPTARFQQGGVD
jgi:hypothetical protein